MPPRPLSPYALQKLAGEHYCQRFTRGSTGSRRSSLRYFNVFGPRQDPSSIVRRRDPAFVSALARGRAPVIFGDGLQTRDFVYVRDVVPANRAAALAPACAARRFNVGRGRARVTVLGRCTTRSRASWGGRRSSPVVAPERARRHPPQPGRRFARARACWAGGAISLAEGLRDTVAWYSETAR